MRSKVLIFLSIVMFSSHLNSQESCEEKSQGYLDSLTIYATNIYEEYRSYTCHPSLTSIELDPKFTKEQRCQILNDLDLLKTLSFQHYGPELEKLISPGSNTAEKAGEEIHQWLLSRIKKLTFYESSVSLAINLGLCSETKVCTKYKRGEIGLSSAYFQKSHPIDRIKILFHEARHTDGHDHLTNIQTTGTYDTLHISCSGSTISLSGNSFEDQGKTCDDDLDGSIGASIFLLGNIIQNCTNCRKLTTFSDDSLHDYYIRNMYNSEIFSINNKDFDLSKILE